MNSDQFLQQANPIMNVVDSMFDRMFNTQTAEEKRAELERAEDDFLARKEMAEHNNDLILTRGL